ncbi:GNAT family N-acetyltransferase, partial [Streptomyces sp. NPDC059814]
MSAQRSSSAVTHPLDDPVGTSLTGPHAHFAERRGRILRYPADVTPWAAVPGRAPGRGGGAEGAGRGGQGGESPPPRERAPPPA